jgi:hypothetical protein
MKKKPRLFYYEEAVDAWIPVPFRFVAHAAYGIPGIIDAENLDKGEECTIKIKRVDLTDKQFNNLPEAG